MAGSSTTPLPKKLGIKEGARVTFPGEPAGFRDVLGSLPVRVEVSPRPHGRFDVIVLFTRKRAELEQRFATLARALQPAGGLWVAWPKKASDVPTDLTFDVVQKTGLGTGLVDNKSCSIDDVYQAVRFVIRKENRPRRS